MENYQTTPTYQPQPTTESSNSLSTSTAQRKYLVAAGVILAISMVIGAWGWMAKSNQPRTVTVNAISRRNVPVNRVDIVAQFTGRNDDKNALVAQSDREFASLVSQLTEGQLAQVEQSAAQVVQATPTIYEYRKAARVRVTDLSLVDSVISIINNNNATVVQTFYSASDEQEIRSELLTETISAARSKADNLARASRLRVGSILQIVEATQPLQDGSVLSSAGDTQTVEIAASANVTFELK